MAAEGSAKATDKSQPKEEANVVSAQLEGLPAWFRVWTQVLIAELLSLMERGRYNRAS